MTNLTNNLMYKYFNRKMYIKNTYMYRRRRETARRTKREMVKDTDRENIEMTKLANKMMYKFQ